MSKVTGDNSIYIIIGIISLVTWLPGTTFSQSDRYSVTSPGGDIEATVFTYHSPDSVFAQGELVYSVSYKGMQVIEPSALNLELEGREEPLGTNVRITDATHSRDNTDSYTLVTGRSSSVNDTYNSLKVELTTNDNPEFNYEIDLRAYDDGVALRYILPEQGGTNEVTLADEHTEFRFVDDAMAYALMLPHFESMYEGEFHKLPISGLGNQGGVSAPEDILIGLPILLDLPGIAWTAIIDADLENYAAAYLRPTGGWTGYRFETSLAQQLENPGVVIRQQLPIQTSWKAIMIADHPGRFIESNLVTSLNPPSRIDDTSWIEAGKASWDWWSGSLNAEGESEYTTENMKRYVDFSAESGFRYMLIDAGWSGNDLTEPNGRVDVPEVVEYATSKGVKIWVWAYYTAVRDQMEEAFATFEDWGVAGIKIDFVERDDQEGIEFYYKTAEAAAKHHLMLDYHGSTKPTGIQRTWPNVLGYEAVVGMEQSKAGRRDNPGSHVMLPFTRMLTGLMDYTPGGFDNVTREQFKPRMQNPMVMGTRAHHLAMYVVYESPFQMVSDHPSAYRGEPSFEFIKNVPATWDETKVLDGEPGEYITIARRNEDQWFVGGMTNEDPRATSVPLSFLDEGRYAATIYRDAADSGENPKQVLISNKIVESDDILNLSMASAGGFAIQLTPAE
ncbi:glycoside hydrolase family 97 protein [Aliifodinibius sp. S!AR15-10]|uniref:glycoside hydrolase family 97 protein n=1 Tax=Aliifodinibius sp. S!AR15-10 TaxID=2950437 RepID=UPI0028622D8A|nr:glycoside hydrolase family 97 protein [Aliifodinibius sp. S!AR15-10]MDR8392429.1 glycoside hydrolase family 97 protein [Aliifodinibius sp. S!AR15-10]